MNKSELKFAQLNEDQLAQIRDLEDKLGANLVALESETRFAALSEADLKAVQDLEKNLGVVLLAYQKDG